MGERSFSKSWGLRASVSFAPFPLPPHSFFFCSRPNFLDKLARKRLLCRLHLGQNVGLGEGLVGRFPETYNVPTSFLLINRTQDNLWTSLRSKLLRTSCLTCLKTSSLELLSALWETNCNLHFFFTLNKEFCYLFFLFIYHCCGSYILTTLPDSFAFVYFMEAFVTNLFHSTLCQAIGHIIKLITFSYPQGYQAHLASTFSEWLMSICFLLYFLTFFREFRKIIVHIQVRPKNAEIFSSGEHDEARIVV